MQKNNRRERYAKKIFTNSPTNKRTVNNSTSLYIYIYKLVFLISLVPLLGMFCLFRESRVKLFFVLAYLLLSGFVLLNKKIKIEPCFSPKNIFVGTLFDAAVFLGFYSYAINQTPSFFIRHAIISPEITVTIAGLVAAALGMFACYVSAKWLCAKLRIFIDIFKLYKIHFILLSLIYVFSFSAIFLANIQFRDDLARNVFGYNLTGSFSRYISTALSELIHTNSYLSDIAPLSQIIALLISAFSGILILYIISDGKELKLYTIIALIPMGLCPYFLSCLSYRFDAPYMAISVFFAIAPLVYRKSKPYKYCISVVVGTLLMCTTYQVSSGVFPIIIIFTALLMWIKKDSFKSIIKYVLTSAGSFLSGLIIFRYLLMTPIDSNYVNTEISISSFPKNCKTLLRYLNEDNTTLWKLLFVVIVVCFVISITKHSSRHKLLSFAITTVAITAMFFLTYGAYLFFANPLTDSRAFYCVGIYISLMSLYLFIVRCNLARVATLLLSWCLVVFSFIYGNTLNIQNEYVNYRTTLIAEDISELNLDYDSTIEIKALGSAVYSKSVKNNFTYYPILSRMVPVTLGDSTKETWSKNQLKDYCGFDMEFMDDSIEINLEEMELVTETYFHDIYQKDNTLVIYIHEDKQ